MIANLMNLTFILATLAVALTLADCWVRGRNAWRIARQELMQLDMAIATDVLAEQHCLGNPAGRRTPSRRSASYGVIRPRRLPRPALAPVHAPVHVEAA